MSVLYSDDLIEITDENLVLKKFGFGLVAASRPLTLGFSFRPKHIKLSHIARIEERQPSLSNGKWRIWGSGTFQTWFPFDWHRSRRDRIFVVILHARWKRFGFTAEDSERVREILIEKGLLNRAVKLIKKQNSRYE